MAQVSFTLRTASSLVERIECWLLEWRRLFREAREQAEIRRKLIDVDEHLLRDIGLRCTGRHYERIAKDEG